jgi:hypothetical protein
VILPQFDAIKPGKEKAVRPFAGANRGTFASRMPIYFKRNRAEVNVMSPLRHKSFGC